MASSGMSFHLFPCRRKQAQHPVGSLVHVLPPVLEASAAPREGGGWARVVSPVGQGAYNVRYEGGAGEVVQVKAAALVPSLPAAASAGRLGGAPVCVLVCPRTGDFRGLASAVPVGGDRILDIGSAFGDSTSLAARAAGAQSVVGVDVGEKFVRRSRERFPHIRFERGDVLEDPLLLARLGKGVSVFLIDIGGIRAAEALVQLIEFVTKNLSPRVIVVKNEQLAERAQGHGLVAGERGGDGRLAPGFWEALCADPSGARAVRPGGPRSYNHYSYKSPSWAPASPLFPNYPLTYPHRTAPGNGGKEICRFHNYAARGCLRGAQGRCGLDHAHCHWCVRRGHAAKDCPDAESVATSLGAATPRAAEERAVPSPSASGPAAAAAVADAGRGPYLYAVAGRNRGQTVGIVDRYSLERGVWERGPLMGQPRGSHGAAAVGGRLLVVGGGGIKSNLVSMECHDGRGGWGEAPPMTLPRHALSAVADGRWVYAVGGWVYGSKCTGGVERFDAGEGRWETLASLRTPRKLFGLAASPGGRIYAFGGATDDLNEAASAECYDPSEGRWAAIAPLPVPALCCAAAVGPRHVHVLLWGRRVVRYDTATDTYESRGKLPLKAWFGFAATAWEGSIYVVGGQTEGRWTGRAFRYDPAADEWHELPGVKQVRRRLAVAVVSHVHSHPLG